jgi:succinate dehydrogenase / fumarate reductase membrane anchor subunit
MRTPLSRVQHFGSAHEGTEHFWRQRLTGAANAILVTATVLIVAYVIGRPYEDVSALVGSPFVAPVFALLFVSVAIHMHIGMQVVVEDYVHSEGAKVILLIASRFFSVAVAAVAIVAILKIAVGA